MDTTKNTQVEPVSSVMKVFSILSELAEHQSIGVTELSGKLMTSKSTVYRFLQTMKMLGYVHQEGETDKYSLSLKLYELSAKALEYVDLIGSADRVMREIGEESKEALHLGTIDEDHIVYVHKVDSQYNLRMQSKVGGRNPLYSTAIGKVLLADRTEQDVRELLKDTEFLPHTENTHNDVDSLIKELDIVREQGFGEDVEEQETGLRCIATPIFDRFGRVIAGMSISYPTLRHTEEKKAHYIELLKQKSLAVSEDLGFHSED
ncbi:DNA-binding transcriptional regulator KdgR [Reinekea blandensis]|uniref:Transcriptional regulator n=1 Tax=Reinekea blandensis MED297 TaxID=314283 RepID=A4BHQ5_9GAMM|nr:DNA-binding transcriptional regulator KdgR [Reinekea blandensis]EAR08310.1 transcriptional regulator [Reinekea sp. MED297] [Reinekea blandensis MED297]